MNNSNNNVKHNKCVKTPSVFQLESSECGSACLAMVLRYYGCFVPMEELRTKCGVSRDGSNAASMSLAAKEYGLDCHGYKRSAKQLRTMSYPCILFWDNNHFVVLEGIKNNKVFLNDPAYGRRKISFEELENQYSGVVLSLAPGKDFKKKKGNDGIIDFFFKRLTNEKSTVTFLVICGVLLIFPGIFLPELTHEFIDKILVNRQYALYVQLILCILFAYIYQIGYTYVRKYVLSRLKQKLTVIYNSGLMNKLVSLPIPFFEQRFAGELSGRLDNNDEVNTFLAGKFSDVIFSTLEALFFLIMLLTYNVFMAIVGISGSLLNAIITIALIEPIKNMNLKLKQDQGRQNALLISSFSAATTMKANGVEDEYARDNIDNYALTTSTEQKIGALQQVLSAFPGAVNNIVNMVVLIVGGSLIVKGDLTVGTLTAFTMLLGTFNQPINQLIGISMELQSTKAGISRVLDIERSESDSQFMTDEKHKDEGFEGYVEFKNVVFGYNPSLSPVINGISFKVAPGSRIGIVGASGCGKSTLAKLITGMVKPWSGEIRIDGIPLDTISHKELTDNVVTVNQNNAIFSGTIRDNLTMWRSDISLDVIKKAARDAEVEELILSLPGEYGSRMTEGGMNLSGGQRQKIEIARALIRNPAILILDEATSALDAIVENTIMNTLKKRNCTMITIAHRLSAIKDCELILVLDKGQIVEYGTHENLMLKKGLYHSLATEGMR